MLKSGDSFVKNLEELEAGIFDAKLIEKTLNSFNKATDVVNFAITREELTIKFFSDIRPYLEPNNKLTIETIINEEKEHLKNLIDMRKKIIKLIEMKKTKIS